MGTTTLHSNPRTINEILDNLRSMIASHDVRSDYIPYVEEKDSVSYKLGKYARKTVSYFKRSETKTSALIATWAIGSMAFTLTFLVLLTSGAFVTATLWIALYAYVTYALFAILCDAAVTNVVFTGK